MESVQQQLFALQDVKYRDFQKNLIPGITPERLIGVRTPSLRELAKRLKKEADISEFLAQLPHTYFDENQLHAFLLAEEKDFAVCICQTEAFLPYVDNWATCDQLSPKVFRKHTDELLPYIQKWMHSDHTYTIRFGIGMLMQHYLDERFDPTYPEMVSQIHSSEYYVNMMIAWYFATALAKQYDAVLPYIENRKLDVWTHNKAIQKSIESRRILPEQKEYLRSLKRSGQNSIENQIHRIRHYEAIFTEVEQALKNGMSLKEATAFQEHIQALSDYYGSPEWKQDFAADEKGQLPAELKRGVLSEDGIYNMLQEYIEISGEGHLSDRIPG